MAFVCKFCRKYLTSLTPTGDEFSAYKPSAEGIIANFYPRRTPPTASKKKPLDFEQSLISLEALVNRMEQGDMTLEESLKAFEEGIALTRECQARLASAELQVTKLIEQQGELQLTPFESDDEGA